MTTLSHARCELECLGRDLQELDDGIRHYPTALLDPECIERIDEALKMARAALPKDGQTPQSGKKEDGWMPIETAPKDGTRILLFMPGCIGDKVWTGLWESGWLTGSSEIPAAYRPTKWMPLPSPPAPNHPHRER